MLNEQPLVTAGKILATKLVIESQIWFPFSFSALSTPHCYSLLFRDTCHCFTRKLKFVLCSVSFSVSLHLSVSHTDTSEKMHHKHIISRSDTAQ